MPGRYLVFVSCVACLLATGLSRAQEAASSRAPPAEPARTTDSLPITTELVSTPLEPEAIRAAIATELRVAVRLEETLVDEGLSVTVKWRRATVSFRSKQGETTTRSLDLPANSEQAVEVIALLAGNLARDEASELLARLAPPPPPPESEAPSDAPTTAADQPASETKPPPAEEKKEPPKPEKVAADDRWHLGSCTKAMTATLCAMLVEEGKLRLTDPVGKFIPELAQLKVAVPNTSGIFAAAPSGAVLAPQPWRIVDAERPITVRDLLTHTSGLVSGGASSASPVAIGAGEALAQVLPRLQNVPLDFQPGTHWAYSGQYGFDVLARIVEVASGMSFDRFTQQRIFAPLGMSDTFFYRAGTDARLATLYTRVDGTLRKQPDGPHVNGAYFSGGGGLTSSAEDYLRFALMLMNGGELEGTRLLGRRTVDLRQRHHPLNVKRAGQLLVVIIRRERELSRREQMRRQVVERPASQRGTPRSRRPIERVWNRRERHLRTTI